MSILICFRTKRSYFNELLHMREFVVGNAGLERLELECGIVRHIGIGHGED